MTPTMTLLIIRDR